ncbi:unnamed protein product, partial [Ectocarpus sp. 8 AP-2014]
EVEGVVLVARQWRRRRCRVAGGSRRRAWARPRSRPRGWRRERKQAQEACCWFGGGGGHGGVQERTQAGGDIGDEAGSEGDQEGRGPRGRSSLLRALQEGSP